MVLGSVVSTEEP